MIERLISYIQVVIAEHGAAGVFLATLLEEVIAPIPSPLVPLAAGFFLLPVNATLLEVTWQALFVIATPVSLGITIGSLTVYSIGYWGGKPAIERSKKWIGLSWEDLEKMEARLTRGRGDEIALFVLRVLPIVPGVAISAFCGIVRYPVKTFAVVTLLGAFTRALMLGIVGWYAGGAYAAYSEAISAVEKYIFVALAVSAALFAGFYFLKRARSRPRER